MRIKGAVAVAVIALGLTACTSAQGSSGDKAGGDPAPLVLRLGTPEIDGTPGRDIVDRFAAAVSDASHGTVTVEVTTKVGNEGPGWDQVAIDALQAGDFDLALIPARAFHSEGVTTLDALQLPTIIETDEQADRVTRSPVVPRLLAGLDAIGVTGLGLYPESLRHIATFGTPEAFTDKALEGKTVRAPRADIPWASLEALGGTPQDPSNFAEEVKAGTIQAAESSLALLGTLPSDSTQVMTANMSLYYKFQVLAAHTSVLDGLDPATQEILRTAAAKAVSTTLANRPTELTALEAACNAGGAVFLAPEDSVAAVRTVLLGTVEQAVQDPAAADLVAAVRTAAGEAKLPPLTPCNRGAVVDPADVKPVAGDLPDGVYRIEVTDAMLLNAGMPTRDVAENHGVYTITLNGGRFTWNQKADNVLHGPTSGSGSTRSTATG